MRLHCTKLRVDDSSGLAELIVVADSSDDDALKSCVADISQLARDVVAQRALDVAVVVVSSASSIITDAGWRARIGTYVLFGFLFLIIRIKRSVSPGIVSTSLVAPSSSDIDAMTHELAPAQSASARLVAPFAERGVRVTGLTVQLSCGDADALMQLRELVDVVERLLATPLSRCAKRNVNMYYYLL